MTEATPFTPKSGLIERYNSDFVRTTRALLVDFSLGTSFDSINKEMAVNVGPKSAFLLAKEVGRLDKAYELNPIFDAFLLACGNEFKGFKKGDSGYEDAKSAVGGKVLEFIPHAFKELGLDVDVKDLIGKVDILDITATLNDFGGDPSGMTMEEIKTSLSKTVPPDDTFIEKVGNLGTDHEHLSKEEMKALSVIIAFAQAGYIHTQIFRAKEESDDRIKRVQCNLNPAMRIGIYELAMQVNGTTAPDWKLRVGFEILKDVFQIKKLFAPAESRFKK